MDIYIIIIIGLSGISLMVGLVFFRKIPFVQKHFNKALFVFIFSVIVLTLIVLISFIKLVLSLI